MNTRVFGTRAVLENVHVGESVTLFFVFVQVDATDIVSLDSLRTGHSFGYAGVVEKGTNSCCCWSDMPAMANLVLVPPMYSCRKKTRTEPWTLRDKRGFSLTTASPALIFRVVNSPWPLAGLSGTDLTVYMLNRNQIVYLLTESNARSPESISQQPSSIHTKLLFADTIVQASWYHTSCWPRDLCRATAAG